MISTVVLLGVFIASLVGLGHAWRYSSCKARQSIVLQALEVDGLVKEKNFLDEQVACSSEGGTWQVSTTRPSSKGKNEVEVIEKESNFVDEQALCQSEGGEWTLLDSQPSIPFPSKPERDQESLLSAVVRRSSRTLALARQWAGQRAQVDSLVRICDAIEDNQRLHREDSYEVFNTFLLKLRRQEMLAELLKKNRSDYLVVANFLGSRIPRNELPNVQNVLYPDTKVASSRQLEGLGETELIDDCPLPAKQFRESPLDRFLLRLFRSFVQEEISYVSPKEGILGLLEEGRYYKLSAEGRVEEHQQAMVRRVLARLLTPFLPPFYRLFMAGIMPSEERGDPRWLVSGSQRLVGLLPVEDWKEKVRPGQQVGPWFYAPFLTSAITPLFMNFLLGPAHVNRRKDGRLGGMLVEKCKFLQESNCKGLCLHQCKLPAQQFFQNTLGVALTVTPNFDTQECQWSWGEEPLPYRQDPDFPKGCIRGCETRKVVIEDY
eukprot:gene8969-9900_t